MPPPATPYQPYAEVHKEPNGPGDARPTSLQIIKDENAIGKLNGKTVLITGCSSGIGVETARYLYEAGATLFLQARDMPKLDGVIEDIVSNAEYNKDGPRPQGVEIHLDSLTSVRKGAEDFKQKSGGKLNILINNAGVMACPYSKTKDGFETQLGVNHFAHFLLFELLKPLLLSSAKESGNASRVINVTSAGHRHGGLKFSNRAELDAWDNGEGYDKWASYGQTKTANIYMASYITRHYEKEGLIAVATHPGGIMTELARHLGEEDYKRLGDLSKILKTPSQGAATTVWAAVSDHFDGKNGGQYLAAVGETPPMTTGALGDDGYAAHAYDEGKEDLLWKLSAEIVGVEA